MKLLLIEDDLTLQNQLQNQLSSQTYQVDCAADGEDGLYRAREFMYDLAIVDIGLPKISGIELVEALRSENNHLPILMLTARSSWRDKVTALKAGADDYLVKPFQPEELMARIEALLRRAAGHSSSAIHYGPITLNLNSGDVTVNGDFVALTAFENKLVHYFFLNPNRVTSKMALAEYLYDEDVERDSNVIEVMIARLRNKLDPDNSIKPIETLRGRGYRLRNANSHLTKA
jgi:two-component system response regulator PhoP